MRYLKNALFRTLTYGVRNNYVTTVSGRRIYPFRPERSDFVIGDFAHALSLLCRWGGHVPSLYSVGQHSIYAYQIVFKRLQQSNTSCPPEVGALMALLHDATETVLADIPSPVKAALPFYRWIERNLQYEIFKHFASTAGRSLSDEMIDSFYHHVRRVDIALLQAERNTLRVATPDICCERGGKVRITDVTLEELVDPCFHYWKPEYTYNVFLDAAYELGIR